VKSLQNVTICLTEAIISISGNPAQDFISQAFAGFRNINGGKLIKQKKEVRSRRDDLSIAQGLMKTNTSGGAAGRGYRYRPLLPS
jgi:hypothetical protein